MRYNLSRLAFVAALMLPVGPGFAESHSDVGPQTVVATVNGTEITLGEMIIAKAQLPDQYQQLPDEVLFSGVLDQLVQQQLLADTLEEVPQRLLTALANEERSLRAGEVVNDIYQNATTEEAVQAAYDTYVEEMGEEMEFNASHILVETEEEAAMIRDMIEAGADFAETAQEKSTGPSGPNGGELGWFGPGMMVTPFENAVVALEIGEVSAPVETQFGWHVIKLNDSRAREAPPIETVRQQLEQQLQRDALEAQIAELTETADVILPEEGAFDPALVNNLDLLED